jgi:hypothetical protein
MVVTRNECGESSAGSPASRSRRFIMRQISLTWMACVVSVPDSRVSAFGMASPSPPFPSF